MNWLEISAAVDVEGVEAVGALFREHVHGGVVIEEDMFLKRMEKKKAILSH